MAEKLPTFTIDWEDWNRGLFIAGESRIKEPTLFLLDILDKYKVKAIFYCLGKDVHEHYDIYKYIEASGHVIGCHGYNHYHDEGPFMSEALYPFRSPFWDKTPMPWPPSGGFFFRFMPYWYVKWAVKKSGIIWLHPHDLDENHPKLKNSLLNLKRHIGLKKSRLKLERLLKEVEWDEPRRA